MREEEGKGEREEGGDRSGQFSSKTPARRDFFRPLGLVDARAGDATTDATARPRRRVATTHGRDGASRRRTRFRVPSRGDGALALVVPFPRALGRELQEPHALRGARQQRRGEEHHRARSRAFARRGTDPRRRRLARVTPSAARGGRRDARAADGGARRCATAGRILRGSGRPRSTRGDCAPRADSSVPGGLCDFPAGRRRR